MQYKYHILNQLNRYSGRDKLRFHMPGHKGVFSFSRLFGGAKRDITELSFSDDLQNPTGCIKSAQDDIAQIVGAKRAYITTDGSTSGVMACVYAAAHFGSKLIVPRNSHKSVFNACRLMGVEPVIVQGEELAGVILPPSVDTIEKLVAGDDTIAGMIISSPDYYGNIAPLDDYAALLKPLGRHLFVDGAHGAHLAAGKGRAGYCGEYADMWVDGAHKTLPALTQGAYVCVNDEELIPIAEEALSIFRTTSPSYPIMASVEYGAKYYINRPEIYERGRAAVLKLKEEERTFTFYPSADWTKLCVDFKPLGVSTDLVQQKLEKAGIYAEMNDGRYLLFYLSPSVTEGQLKRLFSALRRIVSSKKLAGTFKDIPRIIPSAARTYSFLYALGAPCEWVELKSAAGKMCAENVGVTPPCLPVIVAGEIISERAVQVLKSSRNTFGIVNGKIKVVKR